MSSLREGECPACANERARKADKPPYEYTLRATEPQKEMGWLTIIDGEVEWHADDEIATRVAQTALDDAKAEGDVKCGSFDAANNAART